MRTKVWMQDGFRRGHNNGHVAGKTTRHDGIDRYFFCVDRQSPFDKGGHDLVRIEPAAIEHFRNTIFRRRQNRQTIGPAFFVEEFRGFESISYFPLP